MERPRPRDNEMTICKCCKGRTMQVHEIELPAAERLHAGWSRQAYPPVLPDGSLVQRETRIFGCVFCQDGWISVKDQAPGQSPTWWFFHQPNQPVVLTRMTGMTSPVEIDGRSDDFVEGWTYFAAERQLDEAIWFDVLETRRKVLRASTN